MPFDWNCWGKISLYIYFCRLTGTQHITTQGLISNISTKSVCWYIFIFFSVFMKLPYVWCVSRSPHTQVPKRRIKKKRRRTKQNTHSILWKLIKEQEKKNQTKWLVQQIYLLFFTISFRRINHVKIKLFHFFLSLLFIYTFALRWPIYFVPLGEEFSSKPFN